MRLHCLRHSHAQARLAQGPSSSREYFQDGSEFNPAWNTHRIVTETGTDFGIMSMKTSSSFSPQCDSSNEMLLHQFLDHLLRPVPTAECAEMGGTTDLYEIEREDLEILERTDVSSLINGLGNSSLADVKTNIPQKRSALAALGVSGAAVGSVIPALIVPKPAVISKALETLVEPPIQIGPAAVSDILNAIEIQCMDSLRKAIRGRTWPTASEFGGRILEVLSFVANSTGSSEESMVLLEGFTSANPKFFLQEAILLPMIIRSSQEGGAAASAKMITRCRRSFPIVPPKFGKKKVDFQKYRDLFCSLIEKDGVEGVFNVISNLSKNKFLEDPKITANILSQSIFLRSMDLERNVHDWKRVSQSFGNTVGIDIAFDEIFKVEAINPKLTEDILKHSKLYSHPFATLADMICSLVRQKRTDAAQVVFSKVFVTGRYFRWPLRRFMIDDDLESVEILADLVANCMFGEKRRYTAKTRKAKNSEEDANLTALGEVINRFTGTSRRQKKKVSFDEKKIKRHRINEEELHELANGIRDAWEKLAKRRGDGQSIEKLRLWCERNGVAPVKQSG